MLGVYVGRQPIYNQELLVSGYELLFRDCNTDKANIKDHDLATSQVILNTFMEIGIERLVGNGMAFINLTRGFIIEKFPLPMLQGRVVLEILENIPIDKKLITALYDLRDLGYQLALDDVVQPEKVSLLLDVVDIVKLDLIQTDLSRLHEYVSFLRKYNVQLVAEKVETLDMFDLCKGYGFEFYQGFFLCRPNVIEGYRIPAARFNILRLLSKLLNPDLEIREIEQIIRQDVSLSYKLLRLINSVFYGRPMHIKSIRQALTMLGILQIRNWASLLFLSRIDDKPAELVITAMVRARMCEILANEIKIEDADSGFAVGLFSVLDALLDLPIEEILESLPLADSIQMALLHEEGSLGKVLHCTLAYERGDFDEALCPGSNPDITREAYLTSIDWANSIKSLLEMD
ncbi:MAG: HDOD domain-containing protein [Candidatus Latescibacteria bacterium]|nr:HDOD domain-containing protein [Candidatus Latescibacterota bacterium]